MQFPAMLYKPGSMFEWDGEMFDYVIANDEDDSYGAAASIQITVRRRAFEAYALRIESTADP